MNKIYAFIIIIPLIALLFIKTMGFYEFDTKQRYMKNAVDSVAHKVMITGVMTSRDKEELLDKLQKLSDFGEVDVTLECGTIQSDGTIAGLHTYALGNVLDRGEVFNIYVQSKEDSILSRMESDSTNESDRLFYKAKATCRIEKRQQVDA